MSRKETYTGEDLTVVICAYKECPSLGKSIQAILNQTVKPRVMISTSTPNDFISGLAERFGIPVRINPEGGHIRDYNFALRQIEAFEVSTGLQSRFFPLPTILKWLTVMSSESLLR